MAYDIGEMQAAIWRTEEAVQLQRDLVGSEVDPFLANVAKRSLVSLEDLLNIQQRVLDVLLRSQRNACRPLPQHNAIDGPTTAGQIDLREQAGPASATAAQVIAARLEQRP